MFIRRRACIVGGGPAGLAAAIALRRENFDVTVVDCAVPPVDKACGEGLLPDSIAALRQLGIEIPAEAGFPFRGIRFCGSSSSVWADFPSGFAKGIRRTVLHQLLTEHTVRAGASLIWNAKHVRLVDGGVSLDDRHIPADLVVGADGHNSQIRRQAGLAQVKRERKRYGFRQHYAVAPWSSYVELHWGAGCQIYITPTARGEICIAVISRDPQLRIEQALCRFPELQARLKGVQPTSQELGTLSVSRRLQRVQRGNIALLGDASGSVDAITGEGMGLGFKQAHALADAVRCNNLQAYERAHRKLAKRPQIMASLMLTLDRSGQLQRRALAGLARHPDIFKRLLAMHVGVSSFTDLFSIRAITSTSTLDRQLQ